MFLWALTVAGISLWRGRVPPARACTPGALSPVARASGVVAYCSPWALCAPGAAFCVALPLSGAGALCRRSHTPRAGSPCAHSGAGAPCGGRGSPVGALCSRRTLPGARSLPLMRGRSLWRNLTFLYHVCYDSFHTPKRLKRKALAWLSLTT